MPMARVIMVFTRIRYTTSISRVMGAIMIMSIAPEIIIEEMEDSCRLYMFVSILWLMSVEPIFDSEINIELALCQAFYENGVFSISI